MPDRHRPPSSHVSDDDAAPAPAPRLGAPCPTCGVRAVVTTPRASWAPFCCERCKMVDLAKWLGGEVAIPGEPAFIDDFDD